MTSTAPTGRLPGFLVGPLSVLSGLLASLAWAPTCWWPMLFVGVFGLGWLVWDAPRPRSAILRGWGFGLGLCVAGMSWQAAVAIESWLGLALLESLFYLALGGLLYAVRGRRFAPVAAAGCWVLVEFVQQRFPFGGYSWLRLGYPMIDTPLAGYFPVVGVAMTTFVVALIAHVILWAIQERRVRSSVVSAVTVVLLVAVGAAGAAIPGESGPSINVGWVQGGSTGGGFYGIGAPGTVGKAHAAETSKLMGRVAAGQEPHPDFIVWPENGTDMDPFNDPATNAQIANAVASAGVPILTTVPTDGPGPDERQTTALWWTNAGVTARYDKRNIVPFGEWIPFRSVLLPLIPMLGEIGSQTIPGSTPGALHVTGPDGKPLTVGVAICFEVAFPATFIDDVRHGAEVMTVGSNNAMFLGTPQIDQQFNITRARAAELRRPILVVTVSGVSGLIDDHGRTVFTAPEHDAASGVVTMPRTTSLSPFAAGGWMLEPLTALVTALWVISGLFVPDGAPRRGRMVQPTAHDEKRNDG